MTRKQASDFDQGLLDLFDRYVHGLINRREFLDRAASFAVGGVTATALLESLSPKYDELQQVRSDDAQVSGEYVEYSSPRGAGTMRGYLVRPTGSNGDLPGVVVVHENRGLNLHIEDVARRTALAGFLAFAPDALTPLGGYPGNDDDGRTLQGQRDRAEMQEDFVAAGAFLKSYEECSGAVGVVGFCYGGGICNMMAVRVPDLAASVPFYGGQPAVADVPRINAPLLIHYAGLDERINAGWPAYEAALKANNKTYTMHMYEGANHGFHNDTTPRYDDEAATLAWQRTVDFFNRTLR
jgi:carboxymethylenebutenolidase